MKKKIAKKIKDGVVETYSKIADEFDKTRQFGWEEFEYFLNFIEDGDSLVDLGCGNGRFLDFIKKHRKVDYLGIDNSKKFIEIAKKKFGDDIFVQGDMLEIPLEDSFCDVVCAIASFHHIPSDSLRMIALKEIHRVMKPKGVFILSVWNLFQPKYRKYVVWSFLRWVFSFGKFDFGDTFISWGKSGISRYYYAFTLRKLEKLVKKSGFKILEKNVNNNIILVCKKS